MPNTQRGVILSASDKDGRRTSTTRSLKIFVRRKLENYSGTRKYAAPCRNSPADAIGCENTIRIGTKIAPAPGVYGPATSRRVPCAYSLRLRKLIPPFDKSSQTATSS